MLLEQTRATVFADIHGFRKLVEVKRLAPMRVYVRLSPDDFFSALIFSGGNEYKYDISLFHRSRGLGKQKYSDTVFRR
jgi:hypothetical protein